MKKILIATGIFAPDIGGPASYAKTVGARLARQYNVTVLTYSSVFSHKQDSSFPFRVVRTSRLLPYGLRHIVYFLRAVRLASQHDVVVSLNAISAGVPTLLAARFSGKKFIVRIPGDAAWERAIDRKKTALLINDFQKESKRGVIGIMHRLQVWVCNKADGVLVPSEYLADIVHGWGIKREKIKVIYNSVDATVPALSREEARKQIGIAGNLILSVGRMVPWKGFRMLVKVMPQLLQANQFFRLVVVGDGPEMGVLQAMVRNLGLDRKVYLVGKKSPEELAVYLAAADMFVLNTGYEGFSHQILEAMTAGVPVITTAVGGNREIIQQGENGFLVKYNDEFNLIEAIKTLWNVSELRDKFIVQGRETVANFSMARMERESAEYISQFL